VLAHISNASSKIAMFLLMLVISARAEDVLFRLVISRNDAVADVGEYHLDLEARITSGMSKDLNSLTVDVSYDASLTAWGDDPATNWFSDAAGYTHLVSKLSNYYRVLVTGDFETITNNGTLYALTTSWQKLVTLRWTIAEVTAHTHTISSTTDAAAFFAGNPLPDPPADAVTGFAVTNSNETNILAKVKVFLEGPYDATGDTMTTSLNTGGYIPTTSPYSEDFRTVASIPQHVTDWVLLQIRSQATGSAMASKSAFLRKDGIIINDDGSAAQINEDEIAGDYYIVIRHRNHLAVMSKTAQSLSASTSENYDFTTAVSQYYGEDAKQIEPGVYGIYSSDVNASGTVDANDRSATWNDRNKNGYYNSDCNLSGTVDANDRSATWNNRNLFTNVQ
jgi:hypothetical protein